MDVGEDQQQKQGTSNSRDASNITDASTNWDACNSKDASNFNVACNSKDTSNGKEASSTPGASNRRDINQPSALKQEVLFNCKGLNKILIS